MSDEATTATTEATQCIATHPWSKERCILPLGHDGKHEPREEPHMSRDERLHVTSTIYGDVCALVDKLRALGTPWEGVAGVFFGEYVAAALRSGWTPSQLLSMQGVWLAAAVETVLADAVKVVLEPHSEAQKAARGQT